MTSRLKQLIAVIVILGGAAVATWYVWSRYAKSAGGDVDSVASASSSAGDEIEPAYGSVEGEAKSPTQTKPAGGNPVAAKAYASGVELMKAGKLIEARNQLTKALKSGELDEGLTKEARAALTELANKTILSATVYDGDPYTFSYTFKPKEILERIERRDGLHVPPEIILKINGIADATKIQAGQSLKMIRGPFHAVVHKSQFAMDVYLQETFVRRFRIGIGAPQTPTPEGFFCVRRGGKLRGAPYTPPPSSGLPQRAILPGEDGYPLDKHGHWIGLTGIAEKGTNYTAQDGYGIHGTNDPASVGKAASHGCIRLIDADIEMVFAMLYDKYSTVEIRP